MIRWYHNITPGVYMYEAFNSQSRSIGELLGRNETARVVVPQFQRGYSWEKKHVEAFWADISAFLKANAVKGGPDKYFLGPIVIRPEPNSKEFIHLLDGQQRLATATILFSVIRDGAAKLGTKAASDFARDTQRDWISKEEGGYALELGELDKLYFQETVQADPSSDKKPLLRSHRNIQKAKALLTAAVNTKIASLAPAAALSELKILQRTLHRDLVMAAIPVQSERDAFLIFETLNDRGLRLSVPDLLLNYLMRAAKPETHRRPIRDFWNEMLERIGRRDINRFLRHMWVSKYGDLKSQDLFTALKIRIEQDSIGSLDFTRECSEDCEKYVQLIDVDEERIGKNAAPYVRRLVRDLDFQSSIPLLLSGYTLLSPADFERLVKWALVFVTRYSLISGLDMSGLETTFFGLARDIRTKMADPKSAKNCMADIKNRLTSNSPSDDQIKAAVVELQLYPEEARYIVGRLATRMQTKTKEISIDEANLEHIFPKNPAKEWKNTEECEPLLWHIGNLTMLGERLNGEAANKEYSSFKREYYAKNSELEMAQRIAKQYSSWDKSTIEDRAKQLAPLVIEIWNFNNPSRI